MDKPPDACPGKVNFCCSGISEPSSEAIGPPGWFSSFRSQNEYQDHLPGHPGGQEQHL